MCRSVRGPSHDGRVPELALVRRAMQLLSAAVRRGTSQVYSGNGLVVSREQGMRYDVGFIVMRHAVARQRPLLKACLTTTNLAVYTLAPRQMSSHE